MDDLSWGSRLDADHPVNGVLIPRLITLERAGLVTTQKVGRVRTCKLGRSTLAEERAWIEAYRGLWASRFDALDQIVEELKQRDTSDGRRQAK